MIEYIRTLVSNDKQRFIDNEFNLDLTYITPRIVAMSFPSCGFEKIYRNDISQVSKFIQQRHAHHFLVINLSSRTYDYNKFNGKVWDCQWNDHQAPTLLVLFQGIDCIHEFLLADLNHTVFLHCKAGKGRTGTMICAYLMYLNGLDNTLDARYYYSFKRFNSFHRGVTQPSQIRYIGYFNQLLTTMRLNQPFPIKPKYIQKLVIKGFPGDILNKESLKPVMKVFKVEGNQKVYESKWPQGGKSFKRGEEEFTILLEGQLFVLGDILIKVDHHRGLSNTSLFRFNLNTLFISDNIYKVYKNQIDPDKLNEKVMSDFLVEVHFQDICDCWQSLSQNQQCDACTPHSAVIKQTQEDLNQIKHISHKYKGDSFKSKELLFANPANDDIPAFLNMEVKKDKEQQGLSEEEDEEQEEGQIVIKSN